MDLLLVYEDFVEMGRGVLVDYLVLRGFFILVRKIEFVVLVYLVFVLNVLIIYI